MRLLDQYRKLHRDPGIFEGLSIKPFTAEIAELIQRTGTVTVLDWGCGKGAPYRQGWHRSWAPWKLKVALYDPAYPPYATPHKGPVHGIICCDVLEHVPEEELDAMLEEIFAKARRWVFFSVCCRPAKRILPNGENAHCTLKPEGWWMDLIRRKNRRGIICQVRFTP